MKKVEEQNLDHPRRLSLSHPQVFPSQPTGSVKAEEVTM